MARAIERIEQDIQAIQEKTRAIASDLQSAYFNYLTTLGQALRQQLILASYHLCTQGYPESFLKLSLNQRQQLQQAIRQLGQQASEQLLGNSKSQDEGDREQDEIEEHGTDEGDLEVEEDDTNGDDELVNLLSPTPTLSSSPSLFTSSTLASPLSPIELAIWQQQIEKTIHGTLKQVSRETNLLLQKAGILPKKLPEPILEAAAAASEASTDVIPGPPNLLNLVIEIDGGQQRSDDTNLTQIMAINLRLGEIEFADATLSSERKQIRNFLVHLSKLAKEYQKLQREQSIAEAESAWRASWFEES